MTGGPVRRVLCVSAALLAAGTGCGRGGAAIEVLNDLGAYDIMDIYVYPDTTLIRGSNLLPGPLLPGGTFAAEVQPGIYNVVAVDEDGDSYHYGGLMVGNAGYSVRVSLDDMNMGVIHSGSGSTPIVIHNNMQSNSIYYAYATMAAPAWGDDVLRMTVMLPDEDLIIWVVPGTWSLKLEDQDGGIYIREDVDVSAGGYDWAVTESDRQYF
jgi:hypothetical protein